jgi:hypothetical protein
MISDILTMLGIIVGISLLTYNEAPIIVQMIGIVVFGVCSDVRYKGGFYDRRRKNH